jgi:hypothetical protein
MTLRKSRFVPWVLGLVVIGAVAFAAACSGQGEGERCSTQADNNGNDDCAGDLVCTPGGQINGNGPDRCCPADRTQATTPVCAVQTAVGINPGGPDSGAVDTGTTETGTDAAKDSPSTETGATDGGSDAPADG